MQYGRTALALARCKGQDACVRWIEKVAQGVCESQGVTFSVYPYINESARVDAMVRMRVMLSTRVCACDV